VRIEIERANNLFKIVLDKVDDFDLNTKIDMPKKTLEDEMDTPVNINKT
jgi:hypothetical protein